MRRTNLTFLAASLLLFGCFDPTAPLQPPCREPAPLTGTFDPRVPDYIVIFHDGVDARQETTRLAAQYGFEPLGVWEHALLGFWAPPTREVVASLRCEASIKHVQHNAVYTIGD